MNKTLRYPVFMKHDGDHTWLAFVPDFKIYTEGLSIMNAKDMARDAIGLALSNLTESHEPLPIPSAPSEARKMAEADADETFDYSDGELAYVAVKLENSMVKRLETALMAFIESQTVKNGPTTEACALAVPQAARVLIELWDKTDQI